MKTKRKALSLALALILLLSFTALFTSCNDIFYSTQGLSAYEIALQNGFVGSETEWLESLKGVDGADGKDGANGSSSESDENYRRNINEALLASVSIYCETPKADGTNTYSAGSGIIYKLNKEAGSAYIITNYHVIYSSVATTSNKISPNIRIYLYGGYFAGSDTMNETGIKAEFVGGSMTYDIAVLKITNDDRIRENDCKAVKLYDSNLLLPGMRAIAIGNPNGMGTSVTSGIVSVESENITMSAIDGSGADVTMRVIRIDTAVNEGNSGGGLFNENGELIGIVNAKTKSLMVDNIGYAIPSNIAIYCAENILDNCDGITNTAIVKCLVGITVQTTDSYAKYDAASGNITLHDEVTIVEVSATSLLKNELKAGDILTKIKLNGEEITVFRQYQLIDLVLKARVGDTIELTVLRDGETLSFSGVFTEANTTLVP